MADELPKRLPLVISPGNRDDTTLKDAKLVNGYVEKTETGEYHVYKRPGYGVDTTLAAGTGLGTYNWRSDVYAVTGTKLYKSGSSLGTVDSTSAYSFTPVLGIPNLFLKNNTKAYNYDSGSGLVQVVDGDYPVTTVPGVAYLDATVYVMTPEAEIFGSDINDTTSWDPLNKLVAQVEPDGGVALAKQLVYVIAFKEWSTEVFYDAANATGSPLAPLQGAKVNYGCVSAESVQDINGTLLWMATNRTTGISVMRMDAVKAQTISTKSVERLLNDIDTSVIYSLNYCRGGHSFYVLTSKLGNLTLIYDLDENMWHQWTSFTNGEENYFPFVSSTFRGGTHLMQHESDGTVCTMGDTFTLDAGNQITWDLYTPNFDGGNRMQKFCPRMDFIADQSSTTLYVRTSDDDYQTWTNFQTVDLNDDWPVLTDMGSFKKRAHHFRHIDATKLRMQAVDLSLQLGTN